MAGREIMPTRSPRPLATHPLPEILAMSKPLNALILGTVAAVAAVAGLVVANFVFQPDEIPGVKVASGTLLPSPRPIPEFTLQGTDGQPFTRERFEGRWTVVFVGFTHCPDICPNTLGLLKTVHARLAETGQSLQVVLLSVDPERDSTDVLKRYVTYFDPSFIGTTGPTSELDKLGAAMGFVYMKSPGATPETYNVDHSSALILINPQGQVAGYFTPPLRVEPLVADLRGLLAARAGSA
jgi:protein SCO1